MSPACAGGTAWRLPLPAATLFIESSTTAALLK
jgi:hypothetical protein